MSLVIVGDIHLGYERKSFTTKEGKARYREEIYQTSKKVIKEASQKGSVAMVGDLFDKPNNSDEVLVQGLSTCKNFKQVLAGNHDLVNRGGHRTSLQMLSEISDAEFVLPYYSEPGFSRKVLDGSKYHVYSVPYCHTQDLFLESLESAQSTAKELGKPCVLLLHTNYDLQFEKTDTTNNLEVDRAKQLLETFEYIFSGHEHNHSTHFGGRLIMTGSVMPVSMSEMTEKYYFELTDNGDVIKHTSWDPKSYTQFDVGKAPTSLKEGTQFVRVTGQCDPLLATELMKKIVDWWKTCPTLLVCKPEWEVQKSDSGSTVVKSHDIKSIDRLIRDLLPSEDLKAAYDSLLEEV